MLCVVNGCDVTGLVISASSSGSKTGCARTLDLQLEQSPTDPSVPIVEIAAGMQVQFSSDGYEFFGVLSSLKKSTESSAVDVKAHDMGLYLKRNSVTQKIRNATPAAAARLLCSRFGVETGYLDPVSHTFSRNFVNTTLYSAIMTGYTFTSEKNGSMYQIRFDGSLMYVVERGVVIAGTIYPRDNLMSAVYSESIENMINRVDMYDKNGNLQASVYGDTSYGIMAQAMTISDNRGRDYAEKVIRDNRLSRAGTVHVLGNPDCVTGNAVFVYEPYTKVFGKFFIDADTHTWKNGIYTAKLTLNWENTMDAQQAGSELEKSAQKSKSIKVANSNSSGSKYMAHFGPNGELIYEYP